MNQWLGLTNLKVAGLSSMRSLQMMLNAVIQWLNMKYV